VGVVNCTSGWFWGLYLLFVGGVNGFYG
jgi:hypothetical protein